LYLTEEAFAARWKGEGRVFLITEETCIEEWGRALGLTDLQRMPVGRSGTRVVLCNDPGVERPPDGGASVPNAP
jgi:hypothetical protein